ncbi:MAG: hypothetical protein LLF98_01790 [Clostridium sp.]|uniref:hypothetical protein n=1 Tax=Clostridium sp. TaxID=1506 RepID=UPI0025C50E18|nr:hypothetical protein [Clostridium sp.]MCE5220012.1 hypothetical protein [Clostridium sp.]
MNDKIKDLLTENGFYRLSKEERQQKHKEFIENVPKVLSQEEKLELIKIINEETPLKWDS